MLKEVMLIVEDNPLLYSEYNDTFSTKYDISVAVNLVDAKKTILDLLNNNKTLTVLLD
jgi:hypothetical protein